jgi:hypothetical protein
MTNADPGDTVNVDYTVTNSGQQGTQDIRLLTDAPSPIPDANVYLHDDWGDNKIQNRDESGTTTHNGVEGVYRPEWAVNDGSPSASNQELVVDRDEALMTGINLDFGSTITWEWSLDLSVQNGGTSVQFEAGCFSTTKTTSGFAMDEAYGVQFDRNSPYIDLRRHDTNDDFGTTLIGSNYSEFTTSPTTVTVTRSASGTWELFVDGNSKGTADDTTYTTANKIWYGYRDTSTNAITVGEMKVY